MKFKHRWVYKPLVPQDHYSCLKGVSHLSVTEPKKEKPREPRALSSEYHKAHKQLMFWAAILLIWELIGVDLAQAKNTSGTIGAVISSIRNLQAVPWVLLILVAYFLFKFTIEWFQCSVHRRNMRVAQIDFGSAWLVALLSYALYFGQEVSKVQFADIARDPNVLSSLAVGLIGAFTPLPLLRRLTARFFFRERTRFRPDSLHIASAAMGPAALLIWIVVSLIAKRPVHGIYISVGILIGAIMDLILLLFSAITYRRIYRTLEQREEEVRQAEEQMNQNLRDLRDLREL